MEAQFSSGFLSAFQQDMNLFMSGCFAPVPIPVRVTAVQLFRWFALWSAPSQMQTYFSLHFFTSSKEAPPPPPVPLHCSLDLPEPENGWPTIHAIDALKDNFFWSIAAMNCVMIKRPNSVNDIVISSRISYKETILQWSFWKCFHSRIDLPYFPFCCEMR